MMLLMLLLVLASTGSILARPQYIDCVDSSECGTWGCCVLGAGRFSMPRCRPMADTGDSCVPGDTPRPVNTTVSYPDGQTVRLPAVFLGACPCAIGLRCEPLEAVCQDPAQHDGFNGL